MFAVVAAFVILLSVIFAVPASAASVTYSCTSASGAKGDTVTVSVKISSSVQIWGANVKLGFNSSELQYVSCAKGGIVSGGSLNPQGSSINFSGMFNAKSGTVFTAKFKILKDSGSSTLTLSSTENTDYDGNVYSCSATGGRVTVTKPVTGISLNTTSVSLKKGGTAQLSATVTPSDATNRTVTYSSSNSKVATVTSGGKITAVGGGTATITAKAGGKSATCKVTVSVAQTGIKTLGGAERTLGLNSTLRLSVAKVPADATNSYGVTWSSSDTNIATVSSKGTVTGVALGTATITAKSNGWTATYKVTVVEKAEESSSDISSEESSSDVSETETTELTSTEAVTESTTAAGKTEKNVFAGFIAKVKAKINDENNTVTKFYHYCMVAAASAVMAAITIPVTAIITSSIYKNKMKKNGNNTNNTEQR